MKGLLLLILLSPALTHSQDTIRIKANQEQIVKALIEKGFSINKRSDSLISTNPRFAYSAPNSGKNEITIRMRIFFQGDVTLIAGDYNWARYINREAHWLPIFNSSNNKRSWGILKEFADYASK